MEHKTTLFKTLRKSETIFDFITETMNQQKSGKLILKIRGASNTRELGLIYTKWTKRKKLKKID